jgi:outer membrane protein TolC
LGIAIGFQYPQTQQALGSASLNQQAKNAQIGFAQADLFPHFSLFGNLGFQASSSTGFIRASG